MSEPRVVAKAESDVTVLVQIEALCDEFEKAWGAGQGPRIEDVLARGPAAHREKLLAGLLEIELDLRGRAGESISLEQYRGRFPEDAEQVEAVFRRVVKVRRLGNYELWEELGHGGMGVVYLARQVLLNKKVALKLLPERYLADSQVVARFRREMQAIGCLKHDNIVEAHDAGEAEGVQFLATEYVDGMNLQVLVAERMECGQGPLGVGIACEVIRQAALGLQFAFEKGLVHRDIKPANLMLSRKGVVKILDLGLAKLRDERRPVDERFGPLTQDGTTIGTADYMAPEQWDHASEVDIHADIYSLGCTLFFLLTGQPPFGGKSYDSNRRKLLAHAVAPVPSLVAARPGCPAELESISARMMAKEPQDRFGTPGEVAEAMGQFADPEGMESLLPAQSAVKPRSGSEMRTRDSATETPSQSIPRSREKTPPGLADKTRRVRRRNIMTAVATLLAVVVILGTVIGLVRRGDHSEPVTGATLSASLIQHRDTLLLLPGLNGQWWFDEMPWYTPFVRQAVADALASAEGPGAVLGDKPDMYMNANTVAVQKWLWEVVSRCRESLSKPQNRLLDALKEISALNVDDAALGDRLEKALQQFEKDQAGANWSALDRHTLACLQHKLASIRSHLTPTGHSNRQLAEDARKSYDEALNRYPANDLTRRLCLADSALLHSRLLGDYKKGDTKPGEGRRRFYEAQQGADVPSLFKYMTLVTWGSEASDHAVGAGDYESQPFDDAEAVLAQIETEMGTQFANHPLRAQVFTSRGWSLMDQWKVTEARKAFLDAYSILGVNRKSNPFSMVEFFHTRHGLAIASRYQGNASGVQTGFSGLVGEEVFGREGNQGEIREAINAAGRLPDQPGRQRYLRDLTERWANSAERWADCQLYGGAASGGVVSVNSDQACRLYDRARHMVPDPGNRVVMTCKYCIVSALCGGLPEAGKVFDAEVAPVKDGDIIGSDRERAALMRQVASAVLALKDKQRTNEGQRSLREFLGQFRTSNNYDANRRETLELRLLAAELLLTSELQTGDTKAAQNDIKYLDRLLEVFKGRENMQPFLRRYYELAVRAVGKDQPGLMAMAEYLLTARAGHRQDPVPSPQTTRVVFHFAANDDPDPGDNYAILTPPGTIVPLTFTRREVQQAANSGQTLAMPEELLKLIEAEQKAGRSTVLSWDDTTCFFDPNQGLSEHDWKPFRQQLDYAKLRRL